MNEYEMNAEWSLGLSSMGRYQMGWIEKRLWTMDEMVWANGGGQTVMVMMKWSRIWKWEKKHLHPIIELKKKRQNGRVEGRGGGEKCE